MAIKVPNLNNSKLSYGNFPLFNAVGGLSAYKIGSYRPQLNIDFSNDTFTSANKNLGPELVSDGWTLDSGWSQDGQTFTATSAAGNTEAEKSNVVEAGKLYRVRIEFSDLSFLAAFRFYLFQFTEVFTISQTTDGNSGIKEVFALAPSSGYLTALRALNNASGTFNLSIREVVSYSPASTTAANLLTHTRSGNAVQVADDGTLQWAGHNLLTYSEDFNNWSKNNQATVTSNTATAPDGTVTADTLTIGSQGGSGLSWLSQNVIVSTDRPATFSVFLKANGANWVALRQSAFNSGTLYSFFNLATGEIGLDSNSATIEDVGNGWYLCSITWTNIADADGQVAIFPMEADLDFSYTLDGGLSVYVWGAHVYRSDLGGMADIPTSYRGLPSSSTYLPTTSAARYLPRVDNHIWDGSSWVKRCLVEPQSTNLVTYSEDFTDASWAKQSSATVLADTQIAPDGTLTADTLNLGLSGVSAIYIVGTSTAEQTFSVWAKCASGTDTFRFISFNSTDGQVNGPDLTVTTEWQRFSFTYSPTVTNNWYISNSSSAEEKSIFIWGAQLEESSVPTSYIPTAGATVTRPADALSIDSTLLPYDSTAMTIAMEGEMTYADNNLNPESSFLQWRLNSVNRIDFDLQTNVGTGRIAIYQAALGVTDAVAGGSYSPGVNVPFKIASRNTSSDLNGAVDGTALTANTTPTALPDLSATDFQIAPTGVVNIKSLRILGGYGATDAELEAATT